MRAKTGRSKFLVPLALASVSFAAPAPSSPLDPIRGSVILHRPPPTRLQEQFIWTKGDAAALDPALQAKVRGQDDKTAPHYFRARFNLVSPPSHATLYLAGPRSATVYLNGAKVFEFSNDGRREKGFHVDGVDVAAALRPGSNTIAVEEVRGHSSLHTGASPTINQVTYGEVLLVKIVPRILGVDAPPVLLSDASWRSTLQPQSGWTASAFDDSSWPAVQSLGIPGTKSDFLQWNADAGLYAWPGYVGISAAMRTFSLRASAVLGDSSRILHPATLVRTGELVVADAPHDKAADVLLDLGREVSGRVHLISGSGRPLHVETSYGESVEEAQGHPYLGVRSLDVPPNGEVFGPKSGFRYVRLVFPEGRSDWKRIDVQAITLPVRYAGSFESSDPLLNRIWETGAYTAHLCMQEGIWDAPKRDRGRWMGDLDVTGRVISSVFAERRLTEETMTQVIGDEPVTRDVNTITGYSALWITGQAEFYRHLGDLEYLRSMHGRLLQLLELMDSELDEHALFTNAMKRKVFVDWSNGFSADTPEARRATHCEFLAAYGEAAFLLEALGDSEHAALYRAKVDRLREAAEAHLVDAATGTFGDRWQTNAMAVVSGAATVEQRGAIWTHVLARVDDPASRDVITPYYGYYVLAAMAVLDHRAEALTWMRNYWGGMLAEGATSFWEAYDPHWPRTDFHASLEADNKKGYYVSLAHGWASGPAAWLMQQVLGIEPTAGGFAEVTIRPDLAGLTWARGAEPTPHGLLRVSVMHNRLAIDVPPGVKATVLLPFVPKSGTILEDGKAIARNSAEQGRTPVVVSSSGRHVFNFRTGRSL